MINMLKEYLLDEKYDELRKSDDLIYKALEISKDERILKNREIILEKM